MPSARAAAATVLSVKRTLSGHPATVRKRWTADGNSDNMIIGRKGGQITVALIGYARVSTLDQDPALQLDALAAAGCTKVFEDRASGARADRPGLRQALDYVRDGDVLVVWKLDRLGRSLAHLIETVTALETARRRLPLDYRGDRHHDARRPAGIPPVRRAGAVRARPDTRTHSRGACRRRCARPQRRAQTGCRCRETGPRPQHGRERIDCARGRYPAESR